MTRVTPLVVHRSGILRGLSPVRSPSISLSILSPLAVLNDTISIPRTPSITPRDKKWQPKAVDISCEARTSLLGAPMIKVYASIGFGFLLMVCVLLLGKHHADHPIAMSRTETIHDVHKTVSDYLLGAIDAENIKKNLRLLTREPHLAGSEANKRVAHTIAKLWMEAGLEEVHTIPYEVLLSYPDFDRPNRVYIHDSRGQEIFSTSGISPVVFPDEQGGKNSGHQWLAWSAPGRVTADVIFANHGSARDFENLKKMGVDVRGKIALMRYGDGFRGDKVHEAQANGAVGAILYSDPAEVAFDGLDNVYPKTLWMPHDGVQRGSIMHGDGDPLSPLYPSKKGMFRSRTIGEAKKDGVLPSIPALPVSYKTAYQLFKRLQGRPVPLDWQGKINVTYRLGPGFASQEKLTIDVHSTLQTKKIRNVVGYIKGHDEADRYVILGNHFDAWVYGSQDPNSGTAILAEVARAMVETTNQTTWRPARTIMFTAWDAEEYGLVGSTEFVEEYTEILRQRAVIYLNMDCLQGNTSLNVRTTPSLYKATMEVAKRVVNPNKKERAKGRETLYDSWVKTFPSKDGSRPQINIPGGGSDHSVFLNYAGVPVVDFNFLNKTSRDTYPLYHTLYETPFLNEHLLDADGFSIHRATGQYWAELARVFVDEVVLPMNTTELAVTILKEYIPQLKEAINPLYYYEAAIDPAKGQLANFALVAQEFYQISKKFERTMAFTKYTFSQNPYDTKSVNSVNERIMSVDRCFINPRGLPGAAHSRHVLYSLSDKDAYSSKVMAGVYDAVEDFEAAKTEDQRVKAGRDIAFQLTIVQHSINCAIATLREHI